MPTTTSCHTVFPLSLWDAPAPCPGSYPGTYTCDAKEAPQHSETAWAEIGIAAGIEPAQRKNPNLLPNKTAGHRGVGQLWHLSQTGGFYC